MRTIPIIIWLGTLGAIFAQDPGVDVRAVEGASSLDVGAEKPDPAVTAIRMLGETKKSVVRVYWRIEHEQAEPTVVHTPGFCVGEGMFVTVRNEATVSETAIVKNLEGDEYSGNVVLIDPTSGVVMLRVDENPAPTTPALSLGGSREIYVGDTLFGVGLNEDGQAERMIHGALIGRDRSLEGRRFKISHLRPEIPDGLSQGGLPIVNHLGEVVAIDLGAALDDEGEEFHALPVEVLSKLIADLIDHGKREDAWIGLVFNTGTTTPKVVEVRDGSPGAEANILPGDVVIQFDGTRIDTIDDLSDTCYTLTPGREVDIHILRGVIRLQRKLLPKSAASKQGAETPGIPAEP
ncbi:MAG: S1C family serine protease [Verrucomicrobiota bacterium]